MPSTVTFTDSTASSSSERRAMVARPSTSSSGGGTRFGSGADPSRGRAALERRVVHVPDVLADPEYRDIEAQQVLGLRTGLCVPLLKEDELIGVLAIWRTEVRPFTDKQVELVTTFADQAVIAIENVRLFTELDSRNRDLTAAHAQVTESLEQQTATSPLYARTHVK